MECINNLVKSLNECNVKDIFTLSNDTIIEVLIKFENANFNIHCLYAEENIPIVAGACSSYSKKVTVLLLSDGFAINKTINALIASRIKYCPILCIILENDQESTLALPGKRPKTLKVDLFMQKYGVEKIKNELLNDPVQLTSTINKMYEKGKPHILRIRMTKKDNKIKNSSTTGKIKINKALKYSHKKGRFEIIKESKIKEIIGNKLAIAIVGNQILKGYNQGNFNKLLHFLNIRYCVLPSAKSQVAEDDTRYIGAYYGNLSPSSLLTELKKATHIIKMGIEEFPYDYYLSDQYIVSLTNKPNLELISLEDVFTYPVNEVDEKANITEKISSMDRISYYLNSKDQAILNKITSTLSLPSFSPKIIVADVGITCLASLDIMLGPIDGYFSNHASACMGLSLASACGISIAKETVPIWVLIGDGSLLMALNDLLFVANLKHNINIILLDNQQYLTENLREETKYHNMPYVNYKKLSESLGINHYLKIEKIEKVNEALFESLNVKTTSLIHVYLNRTQKKEASMMETLKFLNKKQNEKHV